MHLQQKLDRSYEQKLSCNIKMTARVFNAYFRSKLQLKLDRSYEQKLSCNIKMTPRVFMHISGVNKTYETRSDL